MKVGVFPPAITPSHPGRELLFLPPATSDAMGLKILFPTGVILLPEDVLATASP